MLDPNAEAIRALHAAVTGLKRIIQVRCVPEHLPKSQWAAMFDPIDAALDEALGLVDGLAEAEQTA